MKATKRVQKIELDFFSHVGLSIGGPGRAARIPTPGSISKSFQIRGFISTDINPQSFHTTLTSNLDYWVHVGFFLRILVYVRVFVSELL